MIIIVDRLVFLFGSFYRQFRLNARSMTLSMLLPTVDYLVLYNDQRQPTIEYNFNAVEPIPKYCKDVP